MELTSFSDLGLSSPLQSAVDILGYESPTPIQALTIPTALSGKDIVGISQTGSGKTAAFGLPGLQLVDPKVKSPQFLVLCPTRELCVQVCEELHRLGQKIKQLEVIPVYGGAPIDRQIKALKKGAQVIVGTPGRLIDLMNRRVFKSGELKMVVLDEADRMLDMGFREDMELILSSTPDTRQSLFFSATMNREVESLINKFSKNPETLKVHQKQLTVDTIDQRYYEVRNRSKIEVVSRILDIEKPRLSIVFCNTKLMVDECTESLNVRGYSAEKIHGDITQSQRERVIKRFREAKVDILVATDVAARGLDVDDVDMVINYDLPYDSEDYVHRIGRTGRAGRSGLAVSFIFGKEIYRLQAIEKYIKQIIQRTPIPTQEDVEGQRSSETFNTLKDRLEQNRFKDHSALVDRLLEQGYTPTDIASALFTMLRDQNKKELKQIHEDFSPPPLEAQFERDPKSNRNSRSRFRRGPRNFNKKGGKKSSSGNYDSNGPAKKRGPKFNKKRK